MKTPEIKIQLIHIDGPFKGEINEYLSPVVTFGRHPDCDVAFPAEMLGISRRHAEIRREGNRFLLHDTSSNGTFVNGKQNPEIYLKSGDVLILGLGGPKISFLTTVLEPGDAVDSEKKQALPPQHHDNSRQSPSFPSPPRRDTPLPGPKKPAIFPEVAENPQERSNPVQRSLVIQYGAALKVFKSLPITLGSAADCHFIVHGSAILEHHARIFFQEDQYWVKDLTGHNLLTLDTRPVGTQTPLPANSLLSLSPEGPRFQFLGDGRLMEVEATPAPPQRPHPSTQRPSPPAPHQLPGGRKNTLTLQVLGGLLVLGFGIAAAAFLLSNSAFMELFSDPSMDKAGAFMQRLLGKQ